MAARAGKTAVGGLELGVNDYLPKPFQLQALRARRCTLRRAAQLLASQADVAYLVGFTNLSYFSKCFRAQFGHAPSEHATSPT